MATYENFNEGAGNGPWTTLEEQYLINHIRMGRKRLCVEMDRSLASVHAKIQKLRREGRVQLKSRKSPKEDKKAAPDIEKKTLSLPEFAKVMGISRSLAYILAKEGKLPVIKLGAKRVVVPKAAVEKMLKGGVSNND